MKSLCKGTIYFFHYVCKSTTILNTDYNHNLVNAKSS